MGAQIRITKPTRPRELAPPDLRTPTGKPLPY
jgi:hypothetical protein